MRMYVSHDFFTIHADENLQFKYNYNASMTQFYELYMFSKQVNQGTFDIKSF
ncbi:hypothetical protein GCM10027155_02870 [Acinetobacter apis]